MTELNIYKGIFYFTLSSFILYYFLKGNKKKEQILNNKLKESEIELRKQNELFSILLNNLTQGVFMVEAPSGKPIMANESSKKILGRGIMPDTDHRNISEVYQAFMAETMEPYPSDKMPILRGMYGESLYIDNMVVRRPDGTLTYLEVFGTPVVNKDQQIWASLVSFNDISERKKNEEKIKKNEARLEGLLRISQYKSDSINEFLDFALNEAIELTESKIGYIYLYDESKQEFTLISWSEEVMEECKVVEPQTIYKLEKTGLWGEAVRQRKPILVNNFKLDNPYKKGYPEGHIILERFLTLPIFYNDSIIAVVGVANKLTDYDNSDVRQLKLMMDTVWKITEQKKADILLHEQNRQLERQYEEYMQLNEVLRVTNYDLEEAKSKVEESEKLKSAFLQNISHEIRTPLNGILGFASLLGNDNLEANDREEFLRLIKKSGKRLQLMVENIIEVSKISTSQININICEFDLKSLFDDVLQTNIDFANQENLNLKIEFNDNESILINSDLGKLELIINSLVNNAIKFSKQGEIVMGCTINNNNCLFYVKDEGIGIAKDYHEKIFDTFFQVDTSISRSYEGAGLGLSICKGLVELLGGKIWVESEVGTGSTFWISLTNTQKLKDL